MKCRFEYIKCFWKYTDDETPVLLFYEVDLVHERYAVRMAEIFPDRSVRSVIAQKSGFIGEAPIPTAAEVNQDAAFHAAVISHDEFERVYQSAKYAGSIEFPT